MSQKRRACVSFGCTLFIGDQWVKIFAFASLFRTLFVSRFVLPSAFDVIGHQVPAVANFIHHTPRFFFGFLFQFLYVFQYSGHVVFIFTRLIGSAWRVSSARRCTNPPPYRAILSTTFMSSGSMSVKIYPSLLFVKLHHAVYYPSNDRPLYHGSNYPHRAWPLQTHRQGNGEILERIRRRKRASNVEALMVHGPCVCGGGSV